MSKKCWHNAPFQKSYKNTSTKISAAPYGVAYIFMLAGDSKGQLFQRQGSKVSGGHFVSPWRVPLI